MFGYRSPAHALLVDGTLDGVALLVDLDVERGWSPTVAAPTQPVGLMTGGLGDGGLDPASPQVEADHPVGIDLVNQHPAGSGSGSTAARRGIRMRAITASKASES